MRIFYVVAFGVIALLLWFISWQVAGQVWVVLPVWCSLNSLALADDYYREGEQRNLRKNPDGRLGVLTRIVLLPFLFFALLVWHLQRLLSNEDAWNEVAPGLLIARRLLPSELPVNVKLVVDLTREFSEPRAIREACDYLCRPILDATAPTSVELREIVARIVEHAGPVLVHCANGHGRSALVVAATILQKGLAKDAADSIRQVKTVRPAVRLNRDQRRALENFSRQLGITT